MAAATCGLQGCSLPCHVDPRTGVRHDYCGRTHAQQALALRNQTLPRPHGCCHVCQYPGCDRLVYFDSATGRVHEFCGETHARMAIEEGLHEPSLRGRRCAPSERTCSLPGCNAPRYVDEATGRVHDYCGRTHSRLAAQRGLLAPSHASRNTLSENDDQLIERIWRGRPTDPPYEISVLNNAHPKVDGIKQQFRESWLHPGPVPSVVRVLQVRNAAHVYGRYAAYRNGKPASEVRRWHGTALGQYCSFGVDPNQPPCAYPECSVCNIFAQSFDLSRAGSSATGGRRMQLRYGDGLYFSKCSSKSNDYAALSERNRTGRAYRVMFLCKVTLGRRFDTADDAISDIQPVLDQGYDSVAGLTTDQGGQLNYEETVVYHPSAAIPSYLVIYRLP